MIRNFHYRLYPTKRQVAVLEAQLAWCCDLWNAALEQRRWAYRSWGANVRLGDQQHDLTEAREDGPPMNYVAQEMVLQRLDLAFAAFYRRLRQGKTPGFPRFRSKDRFNTLSFRRGKGGAAIKDERLLIQGVGPIKVKWHRELPGEPRQTRITRRNGRWYVAFTVEVPTSPLPATGDSIGLDLGVRHFASLSNGERVIGPRAGHVAAPAIRRAQRKVARRHRGSHRRRKAVAQLARRREREANRRSDAAHKAAHGLVQRFDLIAAERLPVRNMVRGNRGLAREITDQGWSQFITFLTYKAESAGRRVVLVDPRNTSRTCFACGAVDAESRYGKRFRCVACDHTDDADVNAAKNILALATRGVGPDGAIGREREQAAPLSEKPLLESSLRRFSETECP